MKLPYASLKAAIQFEKAIKSRIIYNQFIN